ncbi:MAG: InlB B-repeat-containing protein, partial [Clostridia bacterium]|nr:InlB B-repeat-containing protein [Clostridia bacterium]
FKQALTADILWQVGKWASETGLNINNETSDNQIWQYVDGEIGGYKVDQKGTWKTGDCFGYCLNFSQTYGFNSTNEREAMWSAIRNVTVVVQPIEYEIDVKLVYNNISGVLGGESPKTLTTVTIRTQRTAGEDKLMGMQNSVGTKDALPVYRQTAAFGFFVNSPVKSGEAFAKELNRVLNDNASSYDIVTQGTHDWEIYAETGVWTIDEDGKLSCGLQEYDSDGKPVSDENGNPKLRTDDGGNLVRPNAVYFEDAESAYLGSGFESAVHDAIKSTVNQKSKTISLYIPLTPKTHSFKFDYRDGWVDGDGDFVKDAGEANTIVGVGSVIVKFSGLAADSDAGEWLKALDESETVGKNISLGVDYSGEVTSLRFDKSVMSNGISFAVEYDPNRTDTLVVAMNKYYQSMYKKAVGENAEFDANAVNTAEAAAYYALSIANAYPTFVMETYTNIGFQITKFANGNNDEIYAALGASGAACTTKVNDLGDAGHTNYIKAAYTDKEYNLKFLHNATEGFKLFFDDGGHVIGTTLSVPNGKGPEDVTTIGYDVVYQVDQNGTMTAMSGVAASGGLFKTYSSIARFVDGSGNPSFGNLYQNGALIAASFVVGQNSVVLNDHLKAVYEFKGWFTAKGNSFDTSGGREPAGKIPDYDEDDGKLDGTIELYAVFEAKPVDFDFDVELSGDKVDDYAYTIANNGFVVESVSHSVSGDIVTGIVHGGEAGIGSANRTIEITLKVDHYYIDRISFVWNNYSLGLNTSETEVWTASAWNSEKQTGGEFGDNPLTNANIETSVVMRATEAEYDPGTDRHYTLYEITLSNCPVGAIAFASNNGEWSFVAGEILIHFSDKNLSIGGENDGSEGVVESPDFAAVSDLEGSQNNEVVVCSSSVTSASFDAKMANVDFNFDDTDDGCVEIVKKDNQSAEGTVLSTLSSDEGGFLQNIHKDDILEMIAKSTGFVGSDPNIVMDGTQFRMMTEFVRNVNFFVQLGTDTVQGSGSVEMAVRYWNGSAYATRILTIAAGTEYAFGIEFVFGFDYVSADAGNYSLSISSVSAVLKMYVLDGNNLCEVLMPDGGWVLKADYEGSNPTLQNTWSQSTSILEFDKSVSASEILITNARRFRAAIIERGNATYDEGYGVVGEKYFGFSTKASDELFADDVNYEIEIYPLLTGSRENQKLPLANATGAYNTAQLFIFEPVTSELFNENGDDINTIDGMGVMIVTRAKSNIHFSASFAEIAHNERVGTFVVDDAGNKSANVNNTFAYGAAPIVSATGNAIANASGVHVTNGYLSMFDGGKVGVEPTYFYAKPGKGQYLKQIDVLYNGVTYTILKNGEMTLDESAGSVYFAEGIASLTRAYVLNDGSSNKVLGCFYLLNEENVVNSENGEFAFAIFGAWDDFTVTVMFSEIKFVQVVAEEEAVKTFVNARGDSYDSVLGSAASDVEEYFARATQSGTIATDMISKMIASIELVVKSGASDEVKTFEIDSSALTVQKKVTGEAGQQTVQYIFTIAIMETSVKTKVSTVVEDEYSTIISSAKGSDLIEMFSKSAGVITPIEGVTLTVPSGKSFVQGIEYLSGDHQTVILTMSQSRRVILSSKLGIGGEDFRDEWNIGDGSQYSNNTETTGFSASFSAVFGRSQTGSMIYDRSAASGSVDGVKAVFFGKKLMLTVSQTNGYHSPSAKVWYVDSLGTTKIGNPIFEGDIKDGQNIEVVASDLDQKYILIEVSQKATEYEISYDPNGGVFDVTVQKSSKIHNVKSELNERAFDSVKKAGYKFLGYSLVANENVKNGEIFTRSKVDFVAFDDVAATGNIMSADGTNPDHGDEITLYAVWAAGELEIAYDLNNGTGSTEGELIESATTLANGDKLYHDHFYGYDPTVEGENKKVKDLAGARRDGYVFIGWSTSLDASDIVPEKDGFIEDKDYVNAQNADDENVITLHAIWRAIEYTVDFDENKGTGSSDPETADEYKITFDSEFANALPAISRNGYTFGGWFLDQACEGQKISSGGNAGTGANTTFNKNLYDAFEAVNGVDDEAKTIKLYAKWEVQSFTIFLDLANTGLYGYGQTGVTFDFDGEYVASVGIQIEFDKTVELLSVKSSVYEFAGWSFKNDNGESGVGSSYVPTASKVTSGVLEAFSFDNNAFETFEENKDAAGGKYVLYAAYRPKVFDFVIAQGSNGYVGGEGLTGNVASNGSFVFGTSQDNEATYAGVKSTRYFVIDAIPNEGYKIKSLTITNTDADNVIHYATINLIWDSEDRMIWVGSDGSTQMIVEANAYFEGLQIDTSEYDETNGINTLRLVIVGAKADIKVAVQFDKQTYEITAVKQTYKSGVLMNEKYSEEKYLVEYGDYVNQTET